MGETTTWDQALADVSTETLYAELLRTDFPDRSLEHFLIQSLPTKDGKDWSQQLARELGVSSMTVRNRVQAPSQKYRESYLAIAVFLGLDLEGTDLLLMKLARVTRLRPRSATDAPYCRLILDRAEFERECPRRDGEPIQLWVRRAPLEDVSAGHTPQKEALRIFLDWIGDTERDKARGAHSFLVKNAGNRRWKAQGFQSQEVKKIWDKRRRELDSGTGSVLRDDLIQLGLLLRMDLKKMNEVLSACDYREIHSNNGHIFETYLFHAWKEFSDYFYSDEYSIEKMPTENLSIDTEDPIPDLQWYFSRKVDHSFKPMRKLLQDVEAERQSLLKKGKQPPALPRRLKRYLYQWKKPPRWYLPKKKQEERFRRLRGEAVQQALREYPRIWKEEQKKIKARMDEIERNGREYAAQNRETPDQLKEAVRQQLKKDRDIFGFTPEESVNCALEEWGFPELEAYPAQSDADVQLRRSLRQLPGEPDGKQMERLYELARRLYGSL